VVRIDARLLAPAGGFVPAESPVADALGPPTLFRFEGEWPALEGDDLRVAAEFLAGVPGLTVAVGVAPDGHAGACDLATPDADGADRWDGCFARAPQAIVTTALLVRRPPADDWAGLVAESAAYSLLQAGEQFRTWLADRRPVAADPRPRLRVDRSRGMAEIVLTRPDRHNALDPVLRDELCEALEALRHEPDLAVAVRGEGPSFCSGGDLGTFGTFPEPLAAHLLRLARSPARLFSVVGPRMVVGLHGACLGAGIELAAFAARVIAADDARIGLPEAGIGLLPGAGGTVSVTRRAGRQRLVELVLTGEPVDARTAAGWGLVDEVVPRADLEARVHEAAASLGPAPC
jgi:enoyl-CoA hydratase/carnithine racemase